MRSCTLRAMSAALMLLQLVHAAEPVRFDINAIIRFHSIARQRIAQQFEYNPEYLCASALVHGKMNKVADERVPHHAAPTNRLMYGRSLIPVRQTNRMIISHKHKLIYLRAHKSASASIVTALSHLLCGKDVVQKTMCDPDALTSQLGPLRDPDMYKDYFVFTFVRNPFTRIASAYSAFTSGLRDLQSDSYDKCAPVPFERFTQNTAAFVEYCQEERCCPVKYKSRENGKVTCSHFRWNDKGLFCKEAALDIVDEHFNDQTHSVFTSQGDSMVDFIGRTEHFDEDWYEMWKLIGERNNQTYDVPPMHTNTLASNLFSREGDPPAKTHINSCGADKYEDMYNETTMRNVAYQYAADLIRLGYLRNFQKVE